MTPTRHARSALSYSDQLELDTRTRDHCHRSIVVYRDRDALRSRAQVGPSTFPLVPRRPRGRVPQCVHRLEASASSRMASVFARKLFWPSQPSFLPIGCSVPRSATVPRADFATRPGNRNRNDFGSLLSLSPDSRRSYRVIMSRTPRRWGANRWLRGKLNKVAFLPRHVETRYQHVFGTRIEASPV